MGAPTKVTEFGSGIGSKLKVSKIPVLIVGKNKCRYLYRKFLLSLPVGMVSPARLDFFKNDALSSIP
jgi:hypothetical protein